LISHRHRFIFIHPVKTGGTSIELALAPFCEERIKLDKKTHHYAVYYKEKMTKHYSFEDYKRLFKRRDLSKYRVIYTLRNPWDRILSAYSYQKMIGFPYANGRKYDSFEEFMRALTPEIKWGKRNIVDMLDGCDWNITLPIIFRDLQFNFNDVCENFLGLPKLELTHTIKSEHGKRSDYYTDETIEIVNRLYSKDIEFFGFSYEQEEYLDLAQA
jgi:hypothetical protein